MNISATIATITAAIAEYKSLAKQYISIGGVTPQESIEELEQLMKDVQTKDYNEYFGDYSDLYKDVNGSRPRPYIPPTLARMKEFSEYVARMWKEEREAEAAREAKAIVIEAARKAKFTRERKRMRNAGSIGDLVPQL